MKATHVHVSIRNANLIEFQTKREREREGLENFEVRQESSDYNDFFLLSYALFYSLLQANEICMRCTVKIERAQQRIHHIPSRRQITNEALNPV